MKGLIVISRHSVRIHCSSKKFQLQLIQPQKLDHFSSDTIQVNLSDISDLPFQGSEMA